MAINAENIIVSLQLKSDQFNRESSRVNKVINSLRGGVDVDLNIDTKGAGNSVGGLKKNVSDFSAFTIARGIGIANVFGQALSAVGGVVKNSFELAKGFEQNEVAFATFLGTTERAREVLADLDRFSLATPFEPTQVIEAGKALIAFGEPVESLQDTLRSIGDIASGTGKDFNELAIIYGKARVAGTLFGEDINQLTEAGVPIIGEFAKQLGVSNDQVKKLASEGKISFEQLETAFKSLTGEGGKFQGLIIAQSRTIGGLQSTLLGALGSLQKAFGDALLPILRVILPPLIDGLFTLVEAARSASRPIAQLFIGTFQAARKAVAPVLDLFTDLFKRFSGGTPIIQRFQGVINFLVRAFAANNQVLASLIRGIASLFSFLANIGPVRGFVNALSNIPQVLGGIVRVFETLPTAIGESFERSKLLVQAFFTDVLSILNPINLGRLIAGTVSLDELLGGGNALRDAANQFQSFGSSIADAFEAGYASIEDIKVELPELDDPPTINKVTNEGENLGEAAGKGFGKGLKDELEKGLPEGSLDALKKALSDAEKELNLVANIGNLDPEGVERVTAAIERIAAKKEDIRLIEALIERFESGVKVEPIDLLPVEIVDENALDELAKKATASLNKANSPVFDLFNLTDEEKKVILEQAEQVFDALKGFGDQLLDQAIARKDTEIAIQEERLEAITSIADRGNAEQLQLEEERLKKLSDEREKFVQRKRQLAAAEIAVENAIAIAGAIRQISTATNPVDLALRAILIAATIASTAATLSGAFGDVPSFKVGTEYFDPANPDATGGGPAILHKGERVLTASQNAKLKGIGNEAIPGLVAAGLAYNQMTIPKSVTNSKAYDFSRLEKQNGELLRTNKRLAKAMEKERQVVNITKDGIYIASQSAQRSFERRNNLRG